MIYTVRTTTGREDIVVDLLSTKIRAQGLPVQSVFHPAEIKGYIFVEAELPEVQKAVSGMMHIKGIIQKPVKLAEVEHFLMHKKEHINIEIGDIVEIIGGPFNGEKGKTKRISANKDEVTVELLEASTPIPVTIAVEFVKILKKGSAQEG